MTGSFLTSITQLLIYIIIATIGFAINKTLFNIFFEGYLEA